MTQRYTHFSHTISHVLFCIITPLHSHTFTLFHIHANTHFIHTLLHKYKHNNTIDLTHTFKVSNENTQFHTPSYILAHSFTQTNTDLLYTHTIAQTKHTFTLIIILTHTFTLFLHTLLAQIDTNILFLMQCMHTHTTLHTVHAHTHYSSSYCACPHTLVWSVTPLWGAAITDALLMGCSFR